MIKYYEIAENRLFLSTHDTSPVQVSIAPDDREKTLLQEQFHLDDYDLNSMLDPDEVPRLDFSDGRLFLIWKTPSSTTFSETIELDVNVVGLSLFQNNLLFARVTDDVLFGDREFRKINDTTDVMMAFLLRTVRHFVSHLKVIRQISTELEKKITVSMENRHLLQMFSLSESLIYYVDAIEGNGAVLAKLRSLSSQLGLQGRHLEMLDDIILENTQATRQATIYSSVLSGLMDARGTIVGNNMTVLLKNLTLINIVFLPLNLIAGIGGMSEWSMMTQKLDWKISYSLFSFGMIVIGWGTCLIVKKLIDRSPARTTARQPTKR